MIISKFFFFVVEENGLNQTSILHLPYMYNIQITLCYSGAAAADVMCHLQFQRSIGEKEEHADLWIGYCAFHLGDYKRAMEVCFHVCLIECVQLGAHIHNVPKIQYLNSDCLSRM